jgi:adenosylcobinamide kinase/adenosylcobinamide-phosphate guanylyltransferase
MAKVIFILGAARSGKSNYAIKLAKSSKKKRVVFVATAQAGDKEMKRRILLHKKARPHFWKTLEEPINLAELIEKNASNFDVLILDCITLFVSNLLLRKYKEENVIAEIHKILTTLRTSKANSIIVSNEVGLGIVPANLLARNFRDISGKINQIISRYSDKVFFMVAGLPLKIK